MHSGVSVNAIFRRWRAEYKSAMEDHLARGRVVEALRRVMDDRSVEAKVRIRAMRELKELEGC